jgi:hypothetical protein
MLIKNQILNLVMRLLNDQDSQRHIFGSDGTTLSDTPVESNCYLQLWL